MIKKYYLNNSQFSFLKNLYNTFARHQEYFTERDATSRLLGFAQINLELKQRIYVFCEKMSEATTSSNLWKVYMEHESHQIVIGSEKIDRRDEVPKKQSVSSVEKIEWRIR